MYYIAKGLTDNLVRWDNGGVILWTPVDPANADYQQYLEWIAEGNVAEPWQPDDIID